MSHEETLFKTIRHGARAVGLVEFEIDTWFARRIAECRYEEQASNVRRFIQTTSK